MAQKRLTRTQFLERLLSIMDRKHHWAWPIIMGPGITKAQLKLHYQTSVQDLSLLKQKLLALLVVVL